MRARYLIRFLLGLTLLAGLAVAWIIAARDTTPARIVEEAVEIGAHEKLMIVREGQRPIPFVSDGCSGGMSSVWLDLAQEFPALSQQLGPHPPWEGCCVVHDRAYHDAGDASDAKLSFDARLLADLGLRSCVIGSASEQNLKPLADAMYLAVRLGGAPCSGLTWRWGYGYPKCK